MNSNERELTEDEAAAKLKLTRHTVSYYRSKGLLSPSKRGRSFVYNSDDLKRLRLIPLLKNCGLNLTEIRRLFELPE